ncbi:MAG: DUF3237 family protein [Myxococcota bacterium]|nr:DUF3237 family protein [Myxococcota bacterium]
MPRAYFLDKALLYLFSYNTEIEPITQRIGVVNAGVRFNALGRPDESRVYHVLREKTEGGLGPNFKVITGRIRKGFDAALYRTDDVVVDEIRMTIETDDGALIGSRYRGTAYLGMGGYDAYVTGIDRVGREKAPAHVPLVITPRYETDHKSYIWLMDYQCVGFARAEVIKSEIRRMTYDIYAMT